MDAEVVYLIDIKHDPGAVIARPDLKTVRCYIANIIETGAINNRCRTCPLLINIESEVVVHLIGGNPHPAAIASAAYPAGNLRVDEVKSG